MRHLATPGMAGELSEPDAIGESGSAGCGDVVRIQLRIAGGTVTEARFLAFGCGAATAAANAACEELTGATIRTALTLSAEWLDRELGGMGTERRHGPELVADAVARAGHSVTRQAERVVHVPSACHDGVVHREWERRRWPAIDDALVQMPIRSELSTSDRSGRRKTRRLAVLEER